MRLQVVGCSGSLPGPHSAASCYVVEHEHEGRVWRLLMDLGNGALGPLQKFVDPLVIDAVLLSHLHADHCVDMCGYYVLRKYHPDGASPRIPVYGPSDTAGRLARAYDLPEDRGMTEEFDFRPYPQTGALEIGPFRITAFPVAHPVEAFALRLEAGGRVLAYSGDTGPCPGLEQAATDADLLLGEAAFCEGEDNPVDLHLTGTDIAGTAVRSGAARLVLTHIPPWYDPQIALEEARAVYDGPIELAATGALFQI